MILVTGATGHLGNVLVRKLARMGMKMRALVLPGDDVSPIADLGIEVVYGDVRNEDDVANAMKGVELVFHLAAVISITPWKKRLVYEVNVKGSENVLKAVKRSSVRMVYVSSVHAFAEPEAGAVIDENTPIDPDMTTGSYGKSKAIATLKMIEAAKQGADVTIICPTGIIGPYDYKGSEMGRVFTKFLRGKLKVFIDGSFDFVDVRDVAEGLIKAAEHGKPGDIYILGNRSITIRKLMQLLEEASGVPAPHVYLPTYLAWLVSGINTAFTVLRLEEPVFTPYAIHTLTRNYAFSHEKAKRELGYNPRPLEETVKDTIEWFRLQLAFKNLNTLRATSLRNR
ncbi:MAG: hypothetical protein PWP37_1646 [Thermotogota bacterium]|nr:hypothetical protein [Thermotogota bacterium]MDK2865454.1 hypothetical protein [Thermotogota bacterium]HCZ05733.1 epimerase [Thermotogota bacterium]